VQIVEPLGQARVIRRLWQAANEERLPHALLFEGELGIGKFQAARWFAAGLLCAEAPGEPCGVCGPCKRVQSGGEAGNHPDLFVVDPLVEEEEQIRVHRIARRSESAESDASVEGFLDLCALEGGARIVIIREAQRMNVAAQNALLKTLEEPRPGTVLVLEAHKSDRLLPTIKSRCVRIRFEPLDAADCAEVLARSGLTGAGAERLARWAEGSPGRALALAARQAETIRDRIAAVLGGEAAPWVAARELFELEGAFEGKTPAARARDRARVILDLALAVVRDRLRAAAGAPLEALPHGDLAADAAGSGRRAPQAQARILERLLVTRGDIERNLSPDAVVERALLVLGDPGAILNR